MAKRKLTLDQLRTIVQARCTKGSAFMLPNAEYDALQSKIKARLEAMSYAEILQTYPEYTYDVKA